MCSNPKSQTYLPIARCPRLRVTFRLLTQVGQQNPYFIRSPACCGWLNNYPFPFQGNKGNKFLRIQQPGEYEFSYTFANFKNKAYVYGWKYILKMTFWQRTLQWRKKVNIQKTKGQENGNNFLIQARQCACGGVYVLWGKKTIREKREKSFASHSSCMQSIFYLACFSCSYESKTII